MDSKSDAKAADEILLQNPSSSGRSSSVSSTDSGNSTASVASSASSIVFTSPFEDTSGLDVFAQIAASAHPLPLPTTDKPTMNNNMQVRPQPELQPQPQIVRRASESTSIVQQSQSQLAQSIYQSQQALRMQQQKRDSVDSNFSSFNPTINGDDDDDFDEDFDDDDDFDSESESGDVRMANTTTKASVPRVITDNNNTHNRNIMTMKASSSSNLLLESPIKEETESDLQMDVDQSINFQRRRSPSLSVTSTDTSPQSIYARRLSAPDNGVNYANTSGYSTRRVIHNICERKRRENIREGFDQLQSRLPAHMANNPKLSKMEILSGAENLIKEIRSRVTNLTAEVSGLTLVLEQMEKKNEMNNNDSNSNKIES